MVNIVNIKSYDEDIALNLSQEIDKDAWEIHKQN